MSDPVALYAESVLAGDTIAGPLVRLACARHVADLEEGHKRGLRWDWPKGERAIKVLEAMHHAKGRWARPRCTCPEDWEACEKRLQLQPWQAFIVGSVFGWQKRNEHDEWIRRFAEVIAFVARKNGKSYLGFGMGGYATWFEGEPEAEFYIAATKETQARYVHDIGKGILRNSPAWQERGIDGFKQRFTNLFTPDGSSCAPVSSEPGTQDSLNPHFVLLDEVHAHRTPALRNVLQSGMGARDQPILCEISTAGLKHGESIWKALRDYSEQVLRGAIDPALSDYLFSYIAEPDPKLDWKTDDLYIQQANPNLGVTVQLSKLQEEREAAKSNPLLEEEFRAKKGNEPSTGSAKSLFDMEAWDACPAELPDDLRERPCYGGFDLAASQDLNAFVLVFPPNRPDGEWCIKPWYWCPQKKLDERRLRDESVVQWARQGLVEVMPGAVRNDEIILDRLMEIVGVYNVVEIGWDRWHGVDLKRRVQEVHESLVVEIAFVFSQISDPTKKLSDLVVSGKLNHGGHPVLSWNAGNSRGQWDRKENVMPDKEASGDRIDGISAAVCALNRALSSQMPKKSKYADGSKKLLVVGPST